MQLQEKKNDFCLFIPSEVQGWGYLDLEFHTEVEIYIYTFLTSYFIVSVLFQCVILGSSFRDSDPEPTDKRSP